MSTQVSSNASIQFVEQTIEFCEKLPNLLTAIETNPLAIASLYREIFWFLKLKERTLEIIKRDVEQIKEFIEREIASHYKKGHEYLTAASKARSEETKIDSVRRAIDEFKDCVHNDTLAFAIEALFLQGMCYDILGESESAMDYYQEAIKKAREFDSEIDIVRNELDAGAGGGAVIGAIGGATAYVGAVVAISSSLLFPVAAVAMATVYGLGGGAALGAAAGFAGKEREITRRLRIDASKLSEYKDANLQLVKTLENLLNERNL